jgi:hypothetical protein
MTCLTRIRLHVLQSSGVIKVTDPRNSPLILKTNEISGPPNGFLVVYVEAEIFSCYEGFASDY